MPVRESGPVSESAVPVRKMSSRREKAESGLIAFMLLGGERWADLVFKTLKPDFFEGPATRRLFEEMSADVSQGLQPDATHLMDRFRENPEITMLISRLLNEEIIQQSDISQFGLDCLLRIIEEKYQEKKDRIKKRLKVEQTQGDDKAKHEWIDTKKVLENLKVEIVAEWKKNVEI
jgi:replicative DNA helicase